MFSNYVEKNTPGAAFGGALRAPPRPEEGVCFQNSLKTYPYVQNILKICQSMFFSKWPIPGFPSFRVWPGTQDPTHPRGFFRIRKVAKFLNSGFEV